MKTMKTGEYVEEFSSGDGRTEIAHLNGIAWHDAPKPNRFHKCWAQTRGFISYFTKVLRCPCGAVSIDNGRHWDEKNSRKS